MRDSNVKQFVGMLGGIASLILPYLAFFMGFGNLGDPVFLAFPLVIAFVLGIVGIIVSAVSIKQAKEYGDGKVKGIIGLITSIIGILSSLIIFLVFGAVILIALNLLQVAAL